MLPLGSIIDTSHWEEALGDMLEELFILTEPETPFASPKGAGGGVCRYGSLGTLIETTVLATLSLISERR